MKKLTLILSAFVLFLMCNSNLSYAVTFGISGSMILPLNENEAEFADSLYFERPDFGFSANAYAYYTYSPEVDIFLEVGYADYISITSTLFNLGRYTMEVDIIPIKGGFRYFVGSGFYFIGAGGIQKVTTKVTTNYWVEGDKEKTFKENKAIYSGALGYAFNRGGIELDFGLLYDHVPDGFNQLSLKLGLNF